MFAKINSLGLLGLNAFAVQAETEVSKGTPCFDIVGLGDTAVKESRERIRAAFRSAGLKFPLARVIVNLAPADTKKTGSVHDWLSLQHCSKLRVKLPMTLIGRLLSVRYR